MWVGLSAVKVDDINVETPLSRTTSTGQLLLEIEKRNRKTDFYKTNLVKCLPIASDKIRYPRTDEMATCYKNLQSEVDEIRPKVIFLLGKLVSDFVGKDKFQSKLPDDFKYKAIRDGNTVYVPIHHPSYILVYKRKQMDAYVKSVSRLIAKYSC